MKAHHRLWYSVRKFLRTTKFMGVTLENLSLKLLYVGVLAAAIIWLLPSERPFQYSNLTVGSIAPEEIIAPVKFAIQKTEEELQRERQEAQAKVPPVFDISPETQNIQILTLNKFFEELQNFFQRHSREIGKKGQKAGSDTTMTPVDSLIRQFSVKYNMKFDQDKLGQFYVIYRNKKFAQLRKILVSGLKEVYQQGILDRSKSEIVEKEITVMEAGIEEAISLEAVREVKDAAAKINEMVKAAFPEDTPMDNSLLQMANYLVSVFMVPNLKYNETTTLERKQNVIHDVPLTRGYVEQDERIVDSHEIITPEIYQKLQSLSLAQRERAASQSGVTRFKFYVGKLLFAVILMMLLILFIYFYRRSTFANNRLLGMITLIFLIQFGAAGLIMNVSNWPDVGIPILLAPMLLAVLMDMGIAFVGTVITSLVLGGALGNDYTFTFMSLMVGGVAIFSVQKIRNRGQMFRAILFIIAAYLTVRLISGLTHFDTIQSVLSDFAMYLLPNAILAPALVYFLIGIFERLFDVTTDITLLELSDLNHPLLKRLSVEAPGSFHHSIMVANLAEAAALAIRTNALLTRVGCYFHDIGKMLKPEYFVENQMGGINKHDSLKPHMSVLILVNHVKAGLELAEKYKLPEAVKQFIPEHHGTSIMSYFYHKALESEDAAEVHESDYRYPGPNPQTKETAISMLADTVEAASRTLQNPTPQRIRNLVESLVDKKVEARQLDACNLTFKEIDRIKEAFIPILTGIHHLRIEYPSEQNEKEKKKSREGMTTNMKPNNHPRVESPDKVNQIQKKSDKRSHADPD